MKRTVSLAAIGRGPFMGIALIGFALNLLQLTGPLYMMQVYDRVISSGSTPTLIGLSIIAGIAYLCSMFLDWLRTRAAHRMSAILDNYLSPICFNLNLNMSKLGPDYKINPIGDLERIRQFMAGPGLVAIFDLPWIPVSLLFVYLLHPILALVTLIGSLMLVAIMVLNGMVTIKKLGQLTEIMQDRNFASESARRNADAINGMGMGGALLQRWDSMNARYLNTNSDVSDSSAMFQSASRAGRFALQSVILGVGAYLVLQGQMSGGAIIASSILSARALTPVDQAVGQWRNFVNARLALRRIYKASAALDEREIVTQLPQPYQSVTLNRLASGPISPRHVVVRDVSMELFAGEALAIVGPSGHGKSTIAKAICGVWPTYSGTVRLDNMQLEHWTPEDRGRFIGYLPQNVQLLPGTIAENISRFLGDSSSEQIIDAARLANAHELIVSLPEGYDTMIEDASGANLSAGQLQRIGLARAFFGLPFLIVLDEPNSNLDNFGEEALTVAINAARQRGSIVVVVTHRSKILSAVDKVMVVQNGLVQRYGPASEVVPAIMGAPPKAVPQLNPREQRRLDPADPQPALAAPEARPDTEA